MNNFKSIKAILSEVRTDKKSHFKQTSGFVQHGNTSVMKHCISVAYVSLMIAKKLHIKVDRKALVRGALLHDYFYMTGMRRIRNIHYMDLSIRILHSGMQAGISGLMILRRMSLCVICFRLHRYHLSAGRRGLSVWLINIVQRGRLCILLSVMHIMHANLCLDKTLWRGFCRGTGRSSALCFA